MEPLKRDMEGLPGRVPASIAIAVPCYNEAITIAKVIADFREVLPHAEIHVFDNASDDRTGEIARECGAHVHFVAARGKGEAVRAMFRILDHDVIVMVDGDDTYPANRVRELVAPVLEGRAEMVVGTRLEEHGDESFRALHVFGNKLVLRCINTFFRTGLSDVLTGYRAFSRRFVKTMPVLSKGFEIETEITLHALEHRLTILEIPVPYGERPEGSVSKLQTFRDGRRVLGAILGLYKDYRPLEFFGIPGLLLLLAGAALGVLVVQQFLATGQVLGVARALLSVACGILGLVSIATGLILDTVNRRSRELYVLIADHVVRRNGSE